MIEIVLFQLLRATVFLAVGFPVVWLLIRFGRLRSALGQRIVWGSLLAVSLLCMTVPLRIPVTVDSFESTVEMTDPIPSWRLNIVEPAEHIAPETVAVSDVSVPHNVVAVENFDTVATVSAKTYGIPSPVMGLFGVWVAGWLVILGRRAFSFLTLQKILRNATTVDDPQWSALLRSFHLSDEKIPED